MQKVLFKRSPYDEEGNEVIAAILRRQPIELVETYSLRRITNLQSATYSWIIVYSTKDAEFASDILTVHELRWQGLSRDRCGVAFIIGNELARKIGDADFLFPMLHDLFVSSELTISFRWVKRELPRLFTVWDGTDEK